MNNGESKGRTGSLWWLWGQEINENSSAKAATQVKVEVHADASAPGMLREALGFLVPPASQALEPPLTDVSSLISLTHSPSPIIVRCMAIGNVF